MKMSEEDRNHLFGCFIDEIRLFMENDKKGLRKERWFDEIKYGECLDVNSLLMVKIIGIEKYVELIEEFGKSQIYFSRRSLNKMKKEFIRVNGDRYSVRELARKLGVSESMVLRVKGKVNS